MEEITLKKLRDIVDKGIQEGHGDKVIHLSNDDEGNGVHRMFYSLTLVGEGEAEEYGLDPEKDIILG